MNKASGSDGIRADLSQILKDEAVKVLHSICQQIWKTHPQEAILKELSRHEPRNQQAISMEISSDESCCSNGNNQARDQAGITQLSWQLSSR